MQLTIQNDTDYLMIHPKKELFVRVYVKDIFGFSFDDFELENYQAHPHIKAPVAI